ncbi:MAG: complement resistance protein TraT [Ectothiorhodospiraceae bacterium]|jgi:hypothetical protein
MKMRICTILGVVAMALGLATGCTQMARGVGSITANKYAEPRSGSVWVVPPPQMEPPRPDDKTVYISFRNISDANVDLTDELRGAAREQGWTLVRDPRSAKYRLRASLRFFGEVKPDSGGVGVARTMGTISGAAVGIGTGYAVANATDSGVAGAAAGVGAGGLAGMGMSNASRPREWAMIVDFVLEEYKDQQVTFKMSTSSGSKQADTAGASNGRMSSGGGTATGNNSSATAKRTSHYFPHGVRLSVWANQMNMHKDEAMPLIVARAEKVVTQMLPQ